MQDALSIDLQSRVHSGDGGLFVSAGQRVETAFVHPGEYELIFVRHGTLKLFEGRSHHTVRENDTYIVWPDRHHGILLSEDDDVSFYWVLFSIEKTPAANAHEQIRVPKCASLEQPERLLELLHRFLDDIRSDRLSKMMGAHLAALMLCEIHRSVANAEQTKGRMATLVDNIQVYISKHYHEPISTCTIADDLSYNPDYLERVFRGATGTSITEAIHKKRIREARRQLIHEYRNISEVAYACGFSDSGYFRRVFKRHTDMTPTKFRALYSQVHLRVS